MKVGNILWKLLRKKGYETVIKEEQIKERWKEIVGDAIGGKTEVSEVKNKCVFVKVKTAAWKNELTFLKPEILKKINDFTGIPVVKDIIFISYK